MTDTVLGVVGLCIITPILGIGVALLWEYIQFSRLEAGSTVNSNPELDESVGEYFYTDTTRIISVRKEGWRTVEIGLETGETFTFKQLWNSPKYGL